MTLDNNLGVTEHIGYEVKKIKIYDFCPACSEVICYSPSPIFILLGIYGSYANNSILEEDS